MLGWWQYRATTQHLAAASEPVLHACLFWPSCVCCPNPPQPRMGTHHQESLLLPLPFLSQHRQRSLGVTVPQLEPTSAQCELYCSEHCRAAQQTKHGWVARTSEDCVHACMLALLLWRGHISSCMDGHSPKGRPHARWRSCCRSRLQQHKNGEAAHGKSSWADAVVCKEAGTSCTAQKMLVHDHRLTVACIPAKPESFRLPSASHSPQFWPGVTVAQLAPTTLQQIWEKLSLLHGDHRKTAFMDAAEFLGWAGRQHGTPCSIACQNPIVHACMSWSSCRCPPLHQSPL